MCEECVCVYVYASGRSAWEYKEQGHATICTTNNDCTVSYVTYDGVYMDT